VPHSLAPHPTDLTPLDFLFWGVVRDIVYREKMQNVNELCDRIFRAKECITNEMLPIPVQKLNIILMCFTSLMVPILKCNEHIRNSVASSV